MAQDPFEGLGKNPNHRSNHEQRFGKRGQVFHFAVTVGVVFIRRPVRDGDGGEDDQRGDQVKAGMRRFRQHADAAALHARQ